MLYSKNRRFSLRWTQFRYKIFCFRLFLRVLALGSSDIQLDFIVSVFTSINDESLFMLQVLRFCTKQGITYGLKQHLSKKILCVVFCWLSVRHFTQIAVYYRTSTRKMKGYTKNIPNYVKLTNNLIFTARIKILALSKENKYFLCPW